MNQEADAFPTGLDTNPNAEPGDDDYEYGASDTLYDQYSFDVDHSPRLPIRDVKADILATIESNPVTIIQAPQARAELAGASIHPTALRKDWDSLQHHMHPAEANRRHECGQVCV